MSSYNAFTQSKITGRGSVPVWLGTVAPRPVGGTLVAAFCKAGILVPAGAPVCFSESAKSITPFYGWEVVSVNSDSHIITVKANAYGVKPEANDLLTPVGTKFDTTGAAGKISAVGAESEGQFTLTMTDGKLDGVTAGTVIAPSTATSVATSGASLKYQPNAYLYNDICIASERYGESYDSISASGSVVDFHGQGLLVERIPYGELSSKLKAAIPNVNLVGY